MKKSSVALMFLMLGSLFNFSLLMGRVLVYHQPYSFYYTGINDSIPAVNLRNFNNDSLDAAYNSKKSSSIYTEKTIGIILPVNFIISSNNNGRWDYQDDGSKIWRLKVHSETAEKIILYFDKFQLTTGVKLFFYPENKSKVFGPFTSDQNRKSSRFSSGNLPSGNLIIELNIPPKTDWFPHFQIKEYAYLFSHPFNPFNRDHIGNSLACNIDVNCPPWVNNWCNEIRSVVKMKILKRIVSTDEIEVRVATGVLLNNPNQDFHPYLLTAKHVAVGAPTFGGFSNLAVNLEDWILYFNFQNPIHAWTPPTGNDEMTVTGVNLLLADDYVNLSCPDLALMEARVPIPLEYNVYYAGWDLRESSEWENVNLVCIHHPQGDLKKVSSGVIDDEDDFCYQVEMNESTGIVEGGSSGAPSFNHTHRVVAVQSNESLDCEEGVQTTNQGALFSVRDSKTEMEDWTQYMGSGTVLNGIDPLGACITNVLVGNNLYPGNDWQARNEILIQASNMIETASVASPAQSVVIQQSPGYMSITNFANYVFRAGNSVILRPGFLVEYGNRFLAENGSCEAFEDCGFNFEFVPERQLLGFSNLTEQEQIEDGLSLVVFPNPTNGLVNISSRFIHSSPAKISLFDPSGGLFWDIRLSGKELFQGIEVELPKDKAGVFILKIEIGNSIITHRIVLIP